ncbi:hypothetical protein [Streptomyces sp. NRRL F-4474]|uniref:hypothetical protein n=1 Tax=Streptomyces sp. NRRL F-4474 TaxID=1463851 RepID=UPI0004CC1B9B|nr:hypothetical protein [Streptomyces sp. NRRL F-4474]
MPDRGWNASLIAGRCRLDAELGRGGSGVVRRATHRLPGRRVAVRETVLDPALSPDGARLQRQRTLREARTAAQGGYPHLIAVHEVVDDGERPCGVVELVGGGSPAERLAGTGPVDPAEAAEIPIRAARRGADGIGGRAAADGTRGRGLHRDIEPGRPAPAAGPLRRARAGTPEGRDPRSRPSGRAVGGCQPASVPPKRSR